MLIANTPEGAPELHKEVQVGPKWANCDQKEPIMTKGPRYELRVTVYVDMDYRYGFRVIIDQACLQLTSQLFFLHNFFLNLTRTKIF